MSIFLTLYFILLVDCSKFLDSVFGHRAFKVPKVGELRQIAEASPSHVRRQAVIPALLYDLRGVIHGHVVGLAVVEVSLQ